LRARFNSRAEAGDRGANVTVLDILLDYRLCFSYDAKISLIEGRIPDAI
jgi:hypothetical protein